MLIRRTISTVLLIGIVITAMLNDWIFGLLITFFIVSGLYEFFTMLEKKGIGIYKYFGIGLGAIIPISIAFRFEPTKKWELFFVGLALIFLIIMQLRRRQTSGAIVDISTTIFGVIYVSWFFSFLIKIKFMEGGAGLFLAVVLITKLGDIGAYLIGMRFGKTPLLARISPNKSIEGAIGGLIFSVLGALISMPFCSTLGGIPHLRGSLSYVQLILVGVCFGALGQLGDLSESLMKRDCKIKDSGILIPGIGGILDLIDSLLFTAPAFYFYISIVLKTINQ